MCWGSGESKSRLAKAAGAEPSAGRRDQKLHAPVGLSAKSKQVRSTFGSWDVQKAHAAVARRRLEVKMAKRRMLGVLLDVELIKKCTQLWREAHVEVKMSKVHHVRTTFGRSTVFFSWEAQWILYIAKSEQNVRVLWQSQKRWQVWNVWRGSAKMHFAWQAQYKRHLHQICWEVRALISWEGLHYGVSNPQVCYDYCCVKGAALRMTWRHSPLLGISATALAALLLALQEW